MSRRDARVRCAFSGLMYVRGRTIRAVGEGANGYMALETIHAPFTIQQVHAGFSFTLFYSIRWHPRWS